MPNDEQRLIPTAPITSLEQYRSECSGVDALMAARAVQPDDVIAEITASGLRGRGGAGFPTGVKWQTVRDNQSEVLATTVVVNAAEGEPGTFKDRTILRANPYVVVEGALIAAHAVEARQVIIATKAAFVDVVAALCRAVSEFTDAGLCGDVEIEVFEGPDEYLYGEETALLEVIDGRPPFPRIAPPFRRGVVEVVEHDEDAVSGSGLAAHVEMAGAAAENLAPPALVDNVETLANVPQIILRGADAFRQVGTERSAGTILCTITGHVRHAGTAEVPLGTTLRDAIDRIGGGALPGRTLTAAMPGVSGALIPAERFDTPLTYEDMASIGSGLGSAGFWILDDSVDPVAAVAGVSRFLAVESCGQCTPCKVDGLTLADTLERIAASAGNETDLATIRKRVDTVAFGARCNLGRQQQAVVQSLLDHFSDVLEDHVHRRVEGVDPVFVAELRDVDDGEVTLNERQADKQPDWTYHDSWDGRFPVERFTDHRRDEPLDG